MDFSNGRCTERTFYSSCSAIQYLTMKMRTTTTMAATRSKLSACLLLLIATLTAGGTSDHRYKTGEHVELWVNKVSPNYRMRSFHVDLVLWEKVILIIRIFCMLNPSPCTGRTLCQSPGSVRVLHAALLRSRYETPSRSSGGQVQRVQTPIDWRVLGRPRAAPFGTRHYI